MATCGWALHALFIIYMVQGSPSPPGHGNGPQPPPLWISGPVVLYSIGPGPVTSGPVVLCSGLDTDLDPGLGPGLGPGRGPGLGSSQLQNQTCRPYYWGVGWGAPDPEPWTIYIYDCGGPNVCFNYGFRYGLASKAGLPHIG